MGERLINLDPSAILNNPSLRAAGYGADIDNYRTYSPPIPTATTVAAEYFAGPKMGISRVGTDEHDGGMVTGRGSTETVGPAPRVKRRRMREQHDEDDSSDLSDDSDEDAETNLRAAQSIKFAKMPIRTRADSSPMRGTRERSGSEPTAPEVFVTHPTVRRPSSGNAETVGPRARRDTTTSSDMSSENEMDPSNARRRIRTTRPRKNSNLQQTYTAGDDELEDVDEEDENRLSVVDAEASDASDLSSEFDATMDSESLLDPEDRLLASPGSADLLPPNMGDDGAKSSPTKRPRHAPTPTLSPLPPARPISQLPPISALGQALRAKNAKPKNPVEPFARFSGKGALDPLNIRIYAPFCKSLDDEPFEMPLQKMVSDSEIGVNSQVTVADALGLALWRYHELKLEPEIPVEKLDVNRWEMRMVDDGEVEYDFPALQRTKNIVDFASNNTRPARGRGRGKAYDEFALVEASEAKYLENKKITPKYTKQFEEYTAAPAEDRAVTPTPQQPQDSALDGSPMNTAVPKPFAFAHRKGSMGLADAPTLPTFATPRTEQQKHLRIKFVSVEGQGSTCVVEFTVDTYLAVVLDNVCHRWGLDKAHHFLRVSGTSTIAPLDRTIEALGNHSELDLVRRRFARDNPTGLASSPASASPNAPLLVEAPATPSKKNRKAAPNVPGPTSNAHPLAQMQDALGSVATFKKYAVMRKQPMSFAPSHPRTLLLENEYLHILPGEEKAGASKTIFDTTVGKTTTVPFGNVVGSKVSRRHPKSFRVLVFKERETKRYDFEAGNPGEAAEIVNEIQAKIKPLQGMVVSNFPLNTQQHNWG